MNYIKIVLVLVILSGCSYSRKLNKKSDKTSTEISSGSSRDSTIKKTELTEEGELTSIDFYPESGSVNAERDSVINDLIKMLFDAGLHTDSIENRLNEVLLNCPGGTIKTEGPDVSITFTGVKKYQTKKEIKKSIVDSGSVKTTEIKKEIKTTEATIKQSDAKIKTSVFYWLLMIVGAYILGNIFPIPFSQIFDKLKKK